MCGKWVTRAFARAAFPVRASTERSQSSYNSDSSGFRTAIRGGRGILVSNDNAHEAPQGAAPDKSNRAFIVLALVFVTAFFAAIAAQIRAHHDNAADTIIAVQSSAAGLIAERVNANLAIAMGASAGVANLARTGGAAPAAIANASAASRPANAAAIVTRNGGTPCGACRQVLAEFGQDTIVLIANDTGQILQETPIGNLLPSAFGPNDLNENLHQGVK